jgi:hypothetical protein
MDGPGWLKSIRAPERAELAGERRHRSADPTAHPHGTRRRTHRRRHAAPRRATADDATPGTSHAASRYDRVRDTTLYKYMRLQYDSQYEYGVWSIDASYKQQATCVVQATSYVRSTKATRQQCRACTQTPCQPHALVRYHPPATSSLVQYNRITEACVAAHRLRAVLPAACVARAPHAREIGIAPCHRPSGEAPRHR